MSRRGPNAPDATPATRSPLWRFGAGSELTTRSRRARGTISAVLLACDLALLVMLATHLHGPVRFIIGLLVVLFVPGWALVGLLKLGSVPLELGLTMAVSLSFLLLAAQLLITINQWQLTWLQVVVCAVCVPSLLWQVRDGRRDTGPAR